ncbi:hypothetical protein ES703_17906 [subsurface metagenome]
MVKIINPLGDVKIGRQGEVVYQRKYGEQIRRQVSPKRAIPSQAQIAHRLLYRAALTWRSQLSLANRRYLDGYCYANGIVDSYHIPLPWSRFALKMYLEKVRFTLSDIQVGGEAEGDFKRIFWWETPNWNDLINGVYWRGQTFLTSEPYTITSVKLFLFRGGTPNIVTVSIRNAHPGNLPTGADLTSGTIDGNTLTTSTSGEKREIALTPYQLEANHRYAIVVNAAGASGASYLYWRGRDSEPRYTEGQKVASANSGVDWTGDIYRDLFFETWEHKEESYYKTATLHVKHPALMKVVHKRGELAINGYDTLSSLDEEYLTGQVGLDVEEGDIIKATTLPGIQYNYAIL